MEVPRASSFVDQYSTRRRHHVQVQWLAAGTGFLGAIQHRDALRTVLGSACTKAQPSNGRYSRTFNKPDFAPFAVESVDGFFDGASARAHQHDHFSRIRRTDVIEQPIVPSCEGREPVHLVLHDVGHRAS